MQDTAQAAAKPDLGAMPEWNLADLYPDPDSPELKRDLAEAQKQALAFQKKFQGKLDGLAKKGGARLAEAVRAYESLQDLLGRIASFAGLLYSADTSDPARAKFYGDIQEKLTAISTSLLFFELEFNRIGTKRLAEAMKSRKLAHYRPWIEDLRKEKPYQLDDEIERLFHEKSVTSRSAWNRLFNETITSLRFDVRGEALSLEPTLNKLLDREEPVRRAAAEALAEVFGGNVRLFTLITNTLAKDKEISDSWRGFEDVADSRHLANRVERPVVEALVKSVHDAYPRLSHRYYALKAKWLCMERLSHWDRNAPLPDQPTRIIAWPEAEKIVMEAYGAFTPEMASIAGRFFASRWIDAPVREGKSPGAFSHPTVPSAHPYIMLNYQGKPRDVMTLAHELGHGVHQV
ncbi:MAG: M3 family oligoendopeptidase, partial [Hyphomicrobiales bacterium]